MGETKVEQLLCSRFRRNRFSGYSAIKYSTNKNAKVYTVEKTSGKKKQRHFPRDNKISDTTEVIGLIIQLYLNHSRSIY